MRENIPGFRRARFHVIKWLGHDIVQNNALVRMLHEARDIAAAKDAALPVAERPSYTIRQKRIFARGAYGDEIAAPPPLGAHTPDEAPADEASAAGTGYGTDHAVAEHAVEGEEPPKTV